MFKPMLHFNFPPKARGTKKILNLKYKTMEVERRRSFLSSAPAAVLIFGLITSGVTLGLVNSYNYFLGKNALPAIPNQEIMAKKDIAATESGNEALAKTGESENNLADNKSNPGEEAAHVLSTKQPEDQATTPKNKEQPVKSAESPKTVPVTNSDSKAQATTPSQTKKQAESIPSLKNMVEPVEAQIIKSSGFTLTKYGDYRLTPVLKYATAKGTAVKAVAGGTVKEISPYEGQEKIIIDHGGDYTSVYYFIKPSIAVGSTLKAGDIVGTATDNLSFQLNYKDDAIKPVF